MADKKTGAEKAVAAAGKKKKPMKKKAPKAAGKTAAQAKGGEVTGDNVGIGHNTKIPSKKELEGYITRIKKLHEEKAEKNAAFMSDIKGVYREMSVKFGVGTKVARDFYAIVRGEERIADMLAEYEVKQKDDMDRLVVAGQAFGKDTPMGAWCIAQGEIEVPDDKPTAQIVEKAPVQSVAAAAQAAMEADDNNKTTH